MSQFARRLGIAGRSGTPADMLVVGLGNPGDQFEGTRHNVGADVVRLLAERHGQQLKRTKSRALAAGLILDGKRVVVAFPQTFMNNSGEAVRNLVRTFGVQEPDHILVVHDELDLDAGRLRLKAGGGLAGHNGLRSITSHLGTTEYLRLRLGVGKPPSTHKGSEWVLRRPSKADQQILDDAIERAADAVEMVIDQGVEAAMAVVNRRAS